MTEPCVVNKLLKNTLADAKCTLKKMKNYWLKTPTINDRFLIEAIEIEKKWSKTGLLSGIRNRSSRAITAVMLESQRLVNEMPIEKKNVSNPNVSGE